ncbi:MAG: MFS transporter [Gammaproteobacteria bacterium]|nr:MFS transporter [Gammaproteobacteria bacterium]
MGIVIQRDSGTPEPAHGRATPYAWLVFALTFGLMLSDYVSRQVITPIFPFLKLEWSLTDVQLGALVSVVALIVGVASIPIALLADRWGRVKSITAMAGLWGLATIGCGLSHNYGQMMAARAFVGLGEAGYGSAGSALLFHVFPKRQHAMIGGAFLAAALFGSVGGVVAGGIISTHFGWRQAFIGVGAAGLLLVALYPFVVRDYATVALVTKDASGERRMRVGEIVRELFVTRTAIFTYLGSGFEMFIMGVVSAWIPSYMSRYYGLAPDQAALRAGLIILVAGVGMIVCGWIVDRLGLRDIRNKLRVPAAFAVMACAVLVLAFTLPPGPMQYALILAGMFVAGAHSGAAGAVISDVTHPGLRATALATVVLGNNLLGLAPGPVIVGKLSDAYGLKFALTLAPLVCLLSAACFLVAAKHYKRDTGHFAEPADSAPANI